MEQATSVKPELSNWVNKGKSDAEIQALLLALYGDAFLADNLMKEVKKLRSARRTSRGLVLVLLGALTLFVSCLLMLTGGFTTQQAGFVLYGLTTIGIVIVFAGLVRIFS